MAGTFGQTGTAAVYLARINILIIKAAGKRRQGQSLDPAALPGATPPGSIAGGLVDRRVLTQAGPGGKVAPVTPLGYKTAVRRLPRIFNRLAEQDPRRRALITLADTAERIGSVRGADLSGSATKGGQSDGGATTRVKHSARLRLIRALANGWDAKAAPGAPLGPEAVALKVGRQSGNLYEIKVFPALWAIIVDGISADELLRQNGWSATWQTRKKLLVALLDALDDVADGLGFGRWAAK